jgi:type VI secretion system protein ImpH
MHTGWGGNRGIEDTLRDEAYAFEFYQAVRLLELRARAAHAHGDAAVPAEPVRFRASFDLSFPASEIRELRMPDSGTGAPEMTVTFFGAGGVDGPLPTSFTEEILERLSRNDTAAAAFLDIFHHRLVWLLYRIRKAHWAVLATDAPEATPAARYLFSLMGLGLPSVRGQLSSPASMLRYAGLLAARPRSAAGLVALLSDCFEVPVAIDQFAGEWCDLEGDQVTRIGLSGQNNILGRSTAVGTRVWIQDAGIRLRIGPIDRSGHERFLPGGRDYERLAELVRFYVGPYVYVTVLLVLRAEDVARTQLGVSRIGWDSWLRTTDAAHPDDQVRVRIVPLNGHEEPDEASA